jgi:hypothetical protein
VCCVSVCVRAYPVEALRRGTLMYAGSDGDRGGVAAAADGLRPLLAWAVIVALAAAAAAAAAGGSCWCGAGAGDVSAGGDDGSRKARNPPGVQPQLHSVESPVSAATVWHKIPAIASAFLANMCVS